MSKNANSPSENSTIHNVRLDSHFTIIANATFEDPNLSWAAKGLLAYILSRSKDWQVHLWQLASIYSGTSRGNGRDAIWALIRELRDEGYIKYTKSRDSKGRWHHRYDVYPMRVKEFQKNILQEKEPEQETREESTVDFQKISPHTVEPGTVEPGTVKPCVLPSTELPRKNLPSKNPPLSSPPKKSFTKPPTKKSLRSEEEEIIIYKCLENTTLNPKERRRLCKEFSESEVQRAIKISKTQPIKKSLMGLLLNILNNPDDWSDQNDSKPVTQTQQIALQYNQKLSKLHPTAAKHNEKYILLKNCMYIITGPKLEMERVSLNSHDFLKDITKSEKLMESQYFKMNGE